MKILMVLLTSHDKLGETDHKTGLWLEEFAAPYFTLLDAGAEVTLASPKGGQPPIDPNSEAPDAQTAATDRFKADEAAQKGLRQYKASVRCRCGRLRRGLLSRWPWPLVGSL